MKKHRSLKRLVIRVAKALTLAVLLGLAASQLRWAVVDWNLNDVDVYWDAAMRIRSGETPYAASAAIDPADPTAAYRYYRYAPWFAALWIPLTLLPRIVAEIGWSVVLLVASAAVAMVPVRYGFVGAMAGLLLAVLLLGISSGGNVQPLMIAALTFGYGHRTGPVWIALAASLKLVPIVLVVPYLARREWARAGWAIGLTVLLLAPAAVFEIPAEVFQPGPGATMPFTAYVATAGLAIAAATFIAVRRPPFAPLAAATAAVLALPRLLTYEVSLIAVGLADLHDRADDPEDVAGRVAR